MKRRPSPKLSLELRAISDLKVYQRNARSHPEFQIEMLVRSIEANSFCAPILIDENNIIIDGNGRLEALRCLNRSQTAVIVVRGLSPANKKALRISLNEIQSHTVVDIDLIKLEIESILDMNVDFDIGSLGFETPKLDFILYGDRSDDSALEPPPPLPEPGPPISRFGDLFRVGDHHLYCGDALDPKSFTAVFGDNRASAAFCDPPYNININGFVSGKGKVRHKEFIEASGEMSIEQYSAFLRTFLMSTTAQLSNGAVIFVCMDWRNIETLLSVVSKLRLSLLNICVWNKSNGGMGGLYRNKHEFIVVLKAGTAPHQNNVELGKHGRNRSNVWDYPGFNSFGKDRDEALQAHPTVKPTPMIADAILDVTARGELVLDPFCGSGSTIIAAEKTGRRCAAIERDPHYIDVAIRRVEKETGLCAIHKNSGLSFEDLTAQRRGAEVANIGEMAHAR